MTRVGANRMGPSESLPRALAAAMAGFLDEYLGVPLAGRGEELRQLDAWLADASRPVALVASEAGRGKSALLAHWAARTTARVVFVPISLRFSTALRGQAWKLLAHGLAAALGRALPETQDAAALRAESLAALASATERVVVVIDGLDEAAGWSCEDLALCAAAAREVKLVFSARTGPGLDAAAWRARLGVDDARCLTLALGALDHDAIRALLASPERDALAAELVRLSEGDPLLVRLYVDALVAGGQLAWMTPADLPRTPPGLDGWFARWWEQLGHTWRGDATLAAVAGAVFDVLATALAPLPRADLEVLVGQLSPASPARIATALRAMRPLLAGDRDAGPFVLGHPRLRYFRLDAMPAPDRARLRRLFADHGERELRELVAGTRAPADASPYLVRHLGVHFDGEDPRRSWRLVCAAWQRAWEALDGTFDGFLGDVYRAGELAAHAAASDDAALRADAVEANARVALVISSVASLTYRLPANLVSHLIAEGIWSPAVALSRVQRPSGGFSSETLRWLAPYLDLPLAREALAVCARHPQLVHDLPRAEGLAALILRLSQLDADVPEALGRFPPNIQAMVAAIAWRGLPRAAWPALARAIRDGAAAVSHCSYAASTAFAALPIIDDAAVRDALIARALARLSDEDFALDNEHAAQLGAAGLWSYGWDAAQRERSAYPRAEMLAFVTPFLPEAMRADAYARWFAAYREETAGGSGISLRIPARLPVAIRDELLRWQQAGALRAKALVAFAYEHPALRAEALRAVRSLTGAHGVAARLALIAALDAPDQRALAVETFELALAMLDAPGRELANAARYWNRGPDDMEWTYIGRYRDPSELVVDALSWMSAEDRSPRVRALFARFRTIDDLGAVLAAAVAAVEAAPAADQPAWLDRLFARRSPDEQDSHALASLARLADRCGDVRCAALAAAAWRGRIQAGDRPAAHALAAIASLLPADGRAELQRAALTRWHDTAGGYNWSDVLRGLRDGLTPEAAAHALSISTPSSGYALDALWPLLPVPRRLAQARERLSGETRHFLWRAGHHALRARIPELPGFGRFLADILDEGARAWRYPANLAWCVAPLCRDGLRTHAEAVRAALTSDPLATWVADLALSPDDPAVLARLPSLIPASDRGDSSNAISLAAALAWASDTLSPSGLAHLASIAASLPIPHSLAFARLLQHRELDALLTDYLTPPLIAALDQGDALLNSGLAPSRWSHLISPARAGAHWATTWQSIIGNSSFATRRRSEALSTFISHLPLALRAGDATTPHRLASLLLELAAWLP